MHVAELGFRSVLAPLAAAVVLALVGSCVDGWDDVDHRRWLRTGDAGAAPVDACEERSSAETFFVSPSGDDARSGRDPDRAWRSLDRVNRHCLVPGDEVLLQGGAQFSGTLRFHVRDGGDPQLPVRVSSYGPERATIEAGEGDGIVIADVSGVIVERLSVRGDWRAEEQAGNAGEGVSVVGTKSGVWQTFLRLRQLDVSGFKFAGIGLHARPSDDRKDSGYRDVEITDCAVHDNGDVGIVSDGPYDYEGPGYSHAGVHIRNARVFGNRGLMNKGEHTGSGIVLSDVDGATIETSVAHHNGEYNDHRAGGGFGIWTWDSTRVIIQSNEAYANDSQTADGGGFALDGGVTDSVLRYNYSHDNQGAGFGAFQFPWARDYGDNRIYYNISQNDGYAFLVWDGNGDLRELDLAHNVGYGDETSFATLSEVTGVRVVNNVFYGLGSQLFDVFDGRGLTLHGNAYWTDGVSFQIRWGSSTYRDFEAYRRGSGQEIYEDEPTGLHADPGFAAPGTAPALDDPRRLVALDAYRMTEDSPLLDRGVDPARFGVELPPRDFYGMPAPRGAARDIGVHELDLRSLASPEQAAHPNTRDDRVEPGLGVRAARRSVAFVATGRHRRDAHSGLLHPLHRKLVHLRADTLTRELGVHRVESHFADLRLVVQPHGDEPGDLLRLRRGVDLPAGVGL